MSTILTGRHLIAVLLSLYALLRLAYYKFKTGR